MNEHGERAGMKEGSEIRELRADEIELVDGGEIIDFGSFRLAGTAYEWGVALGLEVGGTQYIVNIGTFGINAWSQPAHP